MNVCLQSGCLVPQTVDPIVESPHPPPHFVLEDIPNELLPPILALYRQGSVDAAQSPPCHCELEFHDLFVEEDDPTVSLEARWFVDYDKSVPASQVIRRTDPLDADFNSPETVRALHTYFLDADAVGIVRSGVHIVEVVVGETAGFDRASTTQPNRAMKDGYSAAVYKFVVDVRVEPDPARPQCPQTAPSHQVCL